MSRRVNVTDYRRGGKKGSPVLLEIRLRRTAGPKPTRADVVRVLTRIVDEGEVEAGWAVAAVEWQSGRAMRWREGDVSDLIGDPEAQQGGFAALVRDQLAKLKVDVRRVGLER